MLVFAHSEQIALAVQLDFIWLFVCEPGGISPALDLHLTVIKNGAVAELVIALKLHRRAQSGFLLDKLLSSVNFNVHYRKLADEHVYRADQVSVRSVSLGGHHRL